MQSVRDRLTILVFRLFALLPLELARSVATTVGSLLWWSKGRSAEVTQRNIALCLPELDETAKTQLAKKSLQETAKTAVEMAGIWLNPYDELKKHIVGVRGEVLFEQAKAQNKGVLVIIPHLGNWEVVGLYLSEMTKVTSLYQPPKQAVLEDMIKSGRSQLGANLVPTNKRGVMALFKALRAGEAVCILPDQEPALNSGIFAPVFGVQGLTMTLVQGLIQKTGCQAVMCYAARVPKGFEIVFKEVQPGLESADQKESVMAMNASVESCVRENLAQYQWEYKRFKKRPVGESKLY